MKLSAHCNITNPETYGYPYLESIKSFLDLCDEVVVVNGACKQVSDGTWVTDDDGSVDKILSLAAGTNKTIKIVNHYWPDNWTWDELGRHTKSGFDACTGDWAFKFDCDYVFHEKDIGYLRNYLEKILHTSVPPMAVNVRKRNVLLKNKGILKAEMPLIINKRDYSKLTYGVAVRDDTDFMYAIQEEGNIRGMSYGKSIISMPQMIRHSSAEIWCYDFTFMEYDTVELIRQKSLIAEYKYKYGLVEQEQIDNWHKDAMKRFMKMMIERFDRNDAHVLKLEQHPIRIRQKIAEIGEHQFGYSGFGWSNKDESDF